MRTPVFLAFLASYSCLAASLQTPGKNEMLFAFVKAERSKPFVLPVEKVAEKIAPTNIVLKLELDLPKRETVKTNIDMGLFSISGEQKRVEEEQGLTLFNNTTYTSEWIGTSVGRMGEDFFSFDHKLFLGGLKATLRFPLFRWRYPVGVSPMGKDEQLVGFSLQHNF